MFCGDSDCLYFAGDGFHACCNLSQKCHCCKLPAKFRVGLKTSLLVLGLSRSSMIPFFIEMWALAPDSSSCDMIEVSKDQPPYAVSLDDSLAVSHLR